LYGIIHRAIEDLVVHRLGTAAQWQRIVATANARDAFVSLQNYPDEVTLALVGATAEVLGLPLDEVQREFGENWVFFTLKEGYAELLRATGRDPFEFLQNLDELHTRVALSYSYPDLRAPSFECTDMTETSLLVHYRSERSGLAPMVRGLILGVGRLFDRELRVELVESHAGGDVHDVFRVELAS
jgi:hypothetical protein